MKWLRLGLSALGGILIALVCYGAYQYYFVKPAPIVNNTTIQPGATLNVEQGKQVSTSGHLYTGISGNTDTIMLEVGWLW